MHACMQFFSKVFYDTSHMWYITLEKELELYLLWFWLDAMEYKRSYSSISDGWQAVNKDFPPEGTHSPRAEGPKGGTAGAPAGVALRASELRAPTLRSHSLACQPITYSCRKTAKIAKNGLSVGRVSIGLET